MELTLENYLRESTQDLDIFNHSQAPELPARVYLRPKGSTGNWAVFQLKAGASVFLEFASELPGDSEPSV